ncbi:hypothetical protein RGUI_2776 [Rhodovulum sp. P5]|uniref:hypothetical protein n=1 Tax=Rhodovulum sp. P5 TaxID=1564506 RepID=UPI0009C2E4B8|nr:hypothetical protein [Rhodovulum sp. P5]ARE40917.1 hypothetical protein RGUI_2776 [Rhodovulum sp. P5]
MTLSVPVPLADFWDRVPLAQGSTFELDEAMEIDRTAGGIVLPAAIGARLWSGEVRFDVSFRAERARPAAILTALRRPGMPFFAYDRRRPYPLADPDGSALGAATPVLAGIDSADRSRVALSGLPAGYVLSAGDLVGWSYGSAPVRYTLHELAEDATADGAGGTGDVSIAPFWPTGTASGLAVTLIRPAIVAVYDPGTFQPGQGRAGGMETGRGFRFRQTLEY